MPHIFLYPQTHNIPVRMIDVNILGVVLTNHVGCKELGVKTGSGRVDSYAKKNTLKLFRPALFSEFYCLITSQPANGLAKPALNFGSNRRPILPSEAVANYVSLVQIQLAILV